MLYHFDSLTPYVLAKLCQQAYAKTPDASFEDWLLLSISGLNDYGYHGVAYRHKTKPWVVITHRGTNSSLLSNLLSDASLAVGSLPDAQSVAKQFSEHVRASVPPECDVIETGHSLGGYHAEVNVGFLGGYAVTFESPGSQEQMQALELSPNPDNFMSFLSGPNVVNTAKSHIGRLYRIYTYHIDEEGHRLDDMANLVKSLLSTATVGSASTLALEAVKAFCNRQLLSHQLTGLINAMHPHVGYPWLMRQMTGWPSLQGFLSAQVSPSHYSLSARAKETLRIYKQVVAQNRYYEKALMSIPGYQPALWVLPPHLTDPDKTWMAKAYLLDALIRFDAFHLDATLRENFIASLGLNAEEIAHIVAPMTEVESSSSQHDTPVHEPHGSSSSSSVYTSTKSSSKQLEPHVTVTQSLVNADTWVEKNKWLVSLVKSPGDREHAFLLLEGIDDGMPVHIRTDFFLDLDARAEVRSKLPSPLGNIIDSLRDFSANMIGRGFVRSDNISPGKYEELLGGCVHQSWPLNLEHAKVFMTLIAEAAQQDYTYVLTGNHPTSSVSSSISAEPHNCISWCQEILRKLQATFPEEELSFEVGSRWLPVKRPSTVVQTVIATTNKPTSVNFPVGRGGAHFHASTSVPPLSVTPSGSSATSQRSSASSEADRLETLGY